MYPFICFFVRSPTSDTVTVVTRFPRGAKTKEDIICYMCTARLGPCSLGLSATSQQYFSLRTSHPPAIRRQYFSLRTNSISHQPPAKRSRRSRGQSKTREYATACSLSTPPKSPTFPPGHPGGGVQRHRAGLHVLRQLRQLDRRRSCRRAPS
jgi:hypothetical protein